jgi:hypothetical protein
MAKTNAMHLLNIPSCLIHIELVNLFLEKYSIIIFRKLDVNS